jgi:hypothetical protein
LPKHSNKDARSQENVFSGLVDMIMHINRDFFFADGSRGHFAGDSLTKQYQSDRISRLPLRYVSSVLDDFACAVIAAFFYPAGTAQPEISF